MSGSALSNLYVSPTNGNLGVGTTSPAYKLDVNGYGSVSDRLYIQRTGGTGQYFKSVTNYTVQLLKVADDSLAVLGVDTLDASVFRNNATLTIDFDNNGSRSISNFYVRQASNDAKRWLTVQGNTGNVGIGTTSPYSKLTVWGSDTSSAIMANFVNSASTSVMSILNNGKLGVGTTTPFAKLSVAGDSSGNFPLFAVSTSTASATSTAFIIDQNGNVGIGTTSPAYKLEVYDSQNADAGFRVTNASTGNVAAALIRVENSTGSNGRLFKLGSGYSGYRILAANDLGFYNETSGNISILNNYASGKILFAAGAANTAQMVIDTNGNVGIGTTSPWGLLSINPNGITGPAFVIGSSTATNFMVTNGGNVDIGTSSVATSNLFSVQNNGSTNIANFFSATGAPEWTLTNGGVETVAGGIINSGNYYLNNTSSGIAGNIGHDLQFGNGSNWGSVGFYVNTDTTNYSSAGRTRAISLVSSGDVGIGTTSPNWLLQLASTTASNAMNGQLALTHYNASANLKHWVLASEGGNLYLATSSDALATSSVSALTITSNSLFGFGTTTPYAPLSVSGKGAFDLIDVNSTTSTSTLSGGVNIGNGSLYYDYSSGLTNISGMNLGGGLSFDTDAGALTWVNLPLDTTPTAGTVESYSAAIGDSPVLTIYGEANGGLPQNLRVGIGTTTPIATLSVVGTTTSSTSWAFAVADVASTTRFVITDSGNVGIASSSPSYPLSIGQSTEDYSVYIGATGSSTPSFAIRGVNGNGQVLIAAATSTASTTALVVGNNGNTGSDVALFVNSTGSCWIIPNATALSCTSDLRMKQNISSLSPDIELQKVLSLRPVAYNWKTEQNGDPAHTGFIAQEVQPIMPDLVQVDQDGIYSMNYAGLTPYLVSAVQELDINLETIAGTTALTTPSSQSFAASFFSNLFAKIIGWLADVGNGIGKLFAKEVHTDKICVGDASSGETCLTKAQLDSLLTKTPTNADSTQTNADNNSTASSTSASSASSPHSSAPDHTVGGK